MTSLSENICTNEINRNSEEDEFEKVQSTEIREILDNHEKQDKFEQNDVNEDLIEEENDNKITNGFSSDDALINTSPSIVNSDNHQVKEVKEITVNHDNDEQRSKKLFNSKIKHSSMPYQRSAYYINDHSYGAVPYYYYQHQQSLPIPMDKPAPLMFLSAETSTSPSREISTSVSPQNLPPRLRQTSTTEYDTNSPPPPITTTTTTSSSSTTTTTTTKIHTSRRHRTILPHTSNSFLPHPPPLMATPPGVLYSYPHAVHPSGPIAYSIRPPDELELLAFQQQMMNLPPGTMLWPPPGHPHFPPYPISGLVPPPPSAFFPNHTSIPEQQANSFLNPEAAEWIPPTNENDTSSNDQILIDDEINFPPLNSTVNHIQTSSTNNKDSLEYTSAQQQQQQIDHSSEVPSTTPDEQSSISIDNSHISNSKTELPITPPSSLSSSSSSSQDDHNTKPLSSSPVKLTPLNYSTILSQTIENNKLRKTNSIQQRSQQTTNHIHNQLPQKDRTTKQQQKLQMNSSSTSDSNSRRRQPFHKHNNTNRINTRNLLTSELNSPSKPQLTTPELVDDWIEVKSKKTKKFDRITNDYSNEKSFNDEQNTKSFSSTLSLTSTNENTTPTTFTSEDDFDEKDNRDRRLITNTTISNDYNRTLIDDIHRRLEKNERLLIIMRGCPGSGKSTLAKLLNNGYNGVVLSADDYFTDTILNTYTFDSTKLDDAHRSIRQRASDAFKRNLSPIIIDNTNTQAWEMKPYVAMGKEAGYDILLVEPQTPWRYKARELFKRNTHNLPIRRIKDMLTRFEHHLTVQNLLDQISSSSKSISSPSIQQNHIQDSENLDSNHLSKRTYDIVDDSSILNDVRLCINDMILFLTSNFYQTTRSSSSQSSTSLSVSFHDLSLISSTPSSIPSTPTTPHARFPRTFTRFPSTNQDHSFNSEHLLRLPTSAFIRPIETNHLTSTLSVQSKLSEKKRKKNKTKQPTNDLLLNMNNNNNNNNSNRIIKGISIENIQEETYQVLLPEDCLDFVVIDELNDKDSIR